MKRVLQIFRDWGTRECSLNIPLLEGQQGNLQTLEAMRDVVLADRLRPDVRAFVLNEIVDDISGYDQAMQARLIFEFARDRISYQRDPFGVERVADVMSTLFGLNPIEPEGDCGIKSTFIATCCGVLGMKSYFVVIRDDPTAENFAHVFNVVLVDGQFVYYDATPQDAPPGWKTAGFDESWFPIF